MAKISVSVILAIVVIQFMANRALPTKEEAGTVTGAMVGAMFIGTLTGGNLLAAAGGAAAGGFVGNRIGKRMDKR